MNFHMNACALARDAALALAVPVVPENAEDLASSMSPEGRGVFGAHAHEYADRGLPVFPVDTQKKRPAIRGWQRATARRARGWARVPRLAAADGIGLLLGPASGIVEVDIDASCRSWLERMLDYCGATPIVIATARGRAKLWYRHAGERRQNRPLEGWPVDVLGAGSTIAPPSWRDDVGAPYRFLRGSLDDIPNLPAMRIGAFEVTRNRSAGDVQRGRRNNALWYLCMEQARFCDDLAALLDVARTYAQRMPEPLSEREIEKCAASAWGYETSGRNFVGHKKPQITVDDVLMDALLDAPDAYTLLRYLRRWHLGHPSFAIAPRAMSEAESPPWPRRRIAAARDVLVARGYLEELEAPDRRRRKAGRYRLVETAHLRARS